MFIGRHKIGQFRWQSQYYKLKLRLVLLHSYGYTMVNATDIMRAVTEVRHWN